MVNLGIKRKALYSGETPKPEKNWDDEVVYPELHVSGKLAEKMGAGDLDEGDEVKVEVVLKVKRHAKTTTNGKTEYSMDLCLTKMADEMEVVEKDVDDELENEELPETSALAALEQSRNGWEE